MSYTKEPGDWDCTHCGKSNFRRKTSCFGCHRPKNNYYIDNRKRPGDWDCPNCNVVIFASKSECRKCGAKKNQPNTRQGDGEEKRDEGKREGDWNCPRCNSLVFSFRRECKCGGKRSNESEQKDVVFGGDLIVNGDFRLPLQRLPPQQPLHFQQQREGDWDCPKCTEFQFSRNKFCRNCGTPNPSNSEALISEDATDECVVCMEKPKNATIIHGDTGHSVCCLDCAKSLYANGGDCPMCRRKIEKVILNFN